MGPTKKLIILCALVALLSGCATHPSAPREERSPADPWEPLNRQLNGFNRGLDTVSLKPIAKGYRAIFPQSIRTGISNFSLNLRGPLNIVNNLLQGKGKDSWTETRRFVANSTWGILGFVDVGTDMGLERQAEDFGQTLAHWGVPDGPYVIVPILGPFSLRDALMIVPNLYLDPLSHYDNAPVRDRIWAVRLIDIRYRVLPLEDLIAGSPDPYVTIRESYLQNRRYVIWDGNPPEDDDFYDDFEDFEDEEQ
jgi:phospholipid-binding lipoprotein MlaA